MSSSSPTRRHLTSVPEDALAIELERRRSLRLSQRSANHSGQLLPAIHIGRKSSSSSIPASEKGDERDWARSLIADDRMLGPSSPTKKGKEKATMTPDDQGRQRERSVQTRKEADWVIDLDRVASGLEKWNEMDRVIVVLGGECFICLARYWYCRRRDRPDADSVSLKQIRHLPHYSPSSPTLLSHLPSYSSHHLPIPPSQFPEPPIPPFNTLTSHLNKVTIKSFSQPLMPQDDGGHARSSTLNHPWVADEEARCQCHWRHPQQCPDPPL